MFERGFHWFVAVRYLRGQSYTVPGAIPLAQARPARRAAEYLVELLVAQYRKSSKVLLFLCVAAIVAGIGFLITRYGVLEQPNPRSLREVDPWIQATELGMVISFAVAVLMGTLAILRAIFSFFSTVSIAGVWIGTMALVFVLSVMSGFESDLRDKILGSNAHIQVALKDGPDDQPREFIAWEAVRAQIATVDGVVASTPFAVSEVVVAANNNYFNVIIKGIDRETVGDVTDLIDDIDCSTPCTPADKLAVMARLDPLIPDEHPRDVPQEPGRGNGSAVDPAPDDMVDGTDPIDLSPDPEPDPEPDPGFGGDARDLIDDPGAGAGSGSDDKFRGPVDPAPDDLLTSTDEPADYSGPEFDGDGDDVDGDGDVDDDDDLIHSITVSDMPRPSRRTQSLDGVLVGRELAKQIHLYPSQEVRMVSPLSDPANPDATGTPIPFNKDYRVAGQFFTGMYEYDLKFVYVSLDSLQRFLDRGDAIDGIEVRIADPDETPEVKGALQKTLGADYEVKDWQELNRNLFAALALEKIAMFLVLAIIILVASFSIVGNLIMVVVEKGKEIALLKTLGASDRGVTWIFVTQGFLIGTIGTALGVFFGLLACHLAATYGIPINPDVYYIDKLPIHVDKLSVVLIAAAGVVISVGATVYPALMASRLRPSVGLRH